MTTRTQHTPGTMPGPCPQAGGEPCVFPRCDCPGGLHHKPADPLRETLRKVDAALDAVLANRALPDDPNADRIPSEEIVAVFRERLARLRAIRSEISGKA